MPSLQGNKYILSVVDISLAGQKPFPFPIKRLKLCGTNSGKNSFLDMVSVR
jgi:hypothetical protein